MWFVMELLSKEADAYNRCRNLRETFDVRSYVTMTYPIRKLKRYAQVEERKYSESSRHSEVNAASSKEV